MSQTRPEPRIDPLSVVEARVNGGPWVEVSNVIQDISHETVRMRGGIYKPKPGWVHVDSNGHVHAYAHVTKPPEYIQMADRLPTLSRLKVEVPCDGTCGNWDCDGTTRDEWRCTLCQEVVEPETQYVGEEAVLPGTTEWSFEFAPVPDPMRWWHLMQQDAPVSIEVRSRSPHGGDPMLHMFGIGWVDRTTLPDMLGESPRVKRTRMWAVA